MDREPRPEAAKLGWKLESSETRFENKAMKVREDRLRAPGKSGTEFAYAEKGAAVIVVPITHQGQIVLLRQFRYPVDERRERIGAPVVIPVVVKLPSVRTRSLEALFSTMQ